MALLLGSRYVAAMIREPHFSPPVVLTIAGLDPTGGAGLAADITTLAQLGCHCAPVATALTVQNTHNLQQLEPVSSAFLAQQLRAMLDDVPVAAIKIGLLSQAQFPTLIAGLLADYPPVPVVLDPVLAAGGGANLAMPDLLAAMAELYPKTTVICPNRQELQRLCDDDDMPRAVAKLRTQGCQHVLVTGADTPTEQVINHWFCADGQQTFNWSRIPGTYHGTGCTLASAIAAYLAQGDTVAKAIEKAQQYTHQTLQQAYRIGAGQAIPGRIHRA